MSFSVLPSWMVLAGLAGLAAGLYALQRLRVRHRDADVVTLLFWREAVEEAQVRVFRRVFKHWWAYVLVLAAASLLWLAASGPQWVRRDAMQHVILIDGSAGMARGDRFDRACASAARLAATLPEAQRRVLLVAGETRTLVGTGEAALMLDARLDGGRPVATPGGFERELRALARTGGPDAPMTVHLVGDAPVDPAVLDAMPEDVIVRRPALGEAVTGNGNRGIVALGVADAASGRWDAVDLYIETAGAAVEPNEISLRGGVGGDALLLQEMTPGRFAVRDLPAAGGDLEVRLAGRDPLDLDDVATIAVPRRPRIMVAVDDDAPPALRAVLSLDPAVRLVSGPVAADVWVGPATLADRFGGPVLALTMDTSTAAFTVRTTTGTGEAPDAADLVDELALAEIDANALATDAQRPIRLEVTDGPRRSVTVWRELLGDGYDFVDARSFPLVIAATVRWLAAQPPVVPWMAAGEAAAGRLVDDAGRVADGVGYPVAPPAAGRYVQGDGRPVVASLQDPFVTSDRAAPTDTTVFRASRGLDGVGIIGLLAALLLAGEWVLYRRGRIP